MLNDSYHENQELKEKHKLLITAVERYQLITDKTLKDLEELTEQHGVALKYIEHLKDLNANLDKQVQVMHGAFQCVMKKVIDII
jgi:hypothetical protein